MEWDLLWELVTQTGQVSGLERAVRASGSYHHQSALVLCPPWVFAVQVTTISLPWVSEDGLQGLGTYMFTLLF